MQVPDESLKPFSDGAVSELCVDEKILPFCPFSAAPAAAWSEFCAAASNLSALLTHEDGSGSKR